VAGGFNSPNVLLGISAAPENVPGYTSLTAPWIGGASAVPLTQAGYVSLLAVWMGGASAVTTSPPTPPRPIPGGAPRRNQRHWDRFCDIIRDDEEMMELATLIIPAICQD
jgi:hypothetical protein